MQYAPADENTDLLLQVLLTQLFQTDLAPPREQSNSSICHEISFSMPSAKSFWSLSFAISQLPDDSQTQIIHGYVKWILKAR